MLTSRLSLGAQSVEGLCVWNSHIYKTLAACTCMCSLIGERLFMNLKIDLKLLNLALSEGSELHRRASVQLDQVRTALASIVLHQRG